MYGLGNALRGGFVGVGLSLAVGAFAASNPVVTNMFTADPAGLVYNDTMYTSRGMTRRPPVTKVT